MLVVGEKEMNEGKVAVRRQGKGDLGIKGLQEFVNELSMEIKDRKEE
jgi:threonyl-tRNA synthetase